MTMLLKLAAIVLGLLTAAGGMGALLAIAVGWPFHHAGGIAAWAIPGATIGIALAVALVFYIGKDLNGLR